MNCKQSIGIRKMKVSPKNMGSTRMPFLLLLSLYQCCLVVVGSSSSSSSPASGGGGGYYGYTGPTSTGTNPYSVGAGQRYYNPYYQAQQQQQQQQQPEREAVETLPPLPEGWFEAIDPATGYKYYYNKEKNITQWARPAPDEVTTAASLPVDEKQSVTTGSSTLTTPATSGEQPSAMSFDEEPTKHQHYEDNVPHVSTTIGHVQQEEQQQQKEEEESLDHYGHSMSNPVTAASSFLEGNIASADGEKKQEDDQQHPKLHLPSSEQPSLYQQYPSTTDYHQQQYGNATDDKYLREADRTATDTTAVKDGFSTQRHQDHQQQQQQQMYSQEHRRLPTTPIDEAAASQVPGTDRAKTAYDTAKVPPPFGYQPSFIPQQSQQPQQQQRIGDMWRQHHQQQHQQQQQPPQQQQLPSHAQQPQQQPQVPNYQQQAVPQQPQQQQQQQQPPQVVPQQQQPQYPWQQQQQLQQPQRYPPTTAAYPGHQQYPFHPSQQQQRQQQYPYQHQQQFPGHYTQQQQQQQQQGSYYGQPPKVHQQQLQQPQNQLIQSPSSGAVKEALGSAWQSVLGFGKKAQEVASSTSEKVVSGAAMAGGTITSTGAGLWTRAKTSIEQVSKSLFEDESTAQKPQPPYPQQGYSLSQYGVPPPGALPGSRGTPPPHLAQQPYGPQGPYYGQPQQQEQPYYTPAQQQQQQQQQQQPQRSGIPPGAQGIVPRGDVAYPHQRYQQPQGGTGTTLQHTQWGARPPAAGGAGQFQQHGPGAQPPQHQQQYFNPHYGSGGSAPPPLQPQNPSPEQDQKKKSEDGLNQQDPWLISDY